LSTPTATTPKSRRSLGGATVQSEHEVRAELARLAEMVEVMSRDIEMLQRAVCCAMLEMKPFPGSKR